MRILLALLVLFCATAQAQVPTQCEQYRAAITRSAYRTFGPSAPVALLAAQIHQESGCREAARSRVGALGLTQFMPATAADMALRHPDVCAPANPFSADWAIRCRDRYMSDLLRQFRGGDREADDWGMALSAYNGGAGWVNRDQRMCRANVPLLFPCEPCNPTRWWGNIELTPDPRRARWAVKENRGYPHRIMCVIAPRYIAQGWGRGVECPE